jgi:hypothetical protein
MRYLNLRNNIRWLIAKKRGLPIKVLALFFFAYNNHEQHIQKFIQTLLWFRLQPVFKWLKNFCFNWFAITGFIIIVLLLYLFKINHKYPLKQALHLHH